MNKKSKKRGNSIYFYQKRGTWKRAYKKIFGLIFSRSLFFAIGLFVSIAVLTAYAAWNDDVFPDDPLTSARWNDLVDYVENFKIQDITTNQGLRLDGDNVGIIDCAASQIVQRNLLDTEWECVDNDIATGWNHIAAKNIQMNNFWLSGDGEDEGVFIDGSGNVGIGTITPSYALDVESGEAYFGGNVYMGNIEFSQDAGMETAFDMQVSEFQADGTIEGYNFNVDQKNILTIYSQADGVGSVDTTRVG
ncbi:MAG: hypothetical protein ABIC82_05965, partial [bacterium]